MKEKKIFPLKKLIQKIKLEIEWRKEERYYKKMDAKYGDYGLEDDNLKFIWGVKSGDDLCEADACMQTMNDIDIIYDKTKKAYMLGVETAYCFDNFGASCNYLRRCLEMFGKYMDEQGLDKNKPYELFFSNCSIGMTADSIEELYTNFKIFVDGYCNQNIEVESKEAF